MSSEHTGLPEPADLLYECILRRLSGSITEAQIEESEIRNCMSSKGYTEESLTTLQRAFEISERERCRTCNSPRELCGCSTYSPKTYRLYQPIPTEIIRFWTEWLEEVGLFREVGEPDQVDDSRWDLRARYSETDVKLRLFLNPRDCERYDFEPETLEFGVYFTGPIGMVESDYAFSWFELLEDGFEDGFERLFEELQSTFGSKIYDYTTIDDIRGMVEEAIYNYFSDSGYTVFRQVGGAASGQNPAREACRGLSNFIDTGQADLAAVDGERCLVLCHCSKVAGWHIHRFENGRIEASDDLQIVDDVATKTTNKINEARRINKNKSTASSFSKTLSIVAGLLTTIVLWDRLSSVSDLLSSIVPSAISAAISSLILLIDVLVVILLGILIIKPYIDDYWFEWSLAPFTQNEADR